MSLAEKHHVTGLILAGGLSKRMKGRDKGLIPFRNRPMIEYAIDFLAPQTDEILISANRNQNVYQAYGYPVISDTLPGYAGPLAGILSAMQNMKHELLFIMPCDTPLVPADLMLRLKETLLESGRRICCVHDGERVHPLHLLLHGSLLPDLQEYLQSGQHRVQKWIERHQPAYCPFSGSGDAFTNLNHATDLQQLEQLLVQPD